MADPVAAHYANDENLADVIAERLQLAGKNLDHLTTADLATVDEFHIRGRKATIELGERMKLTKDSRVLDIGSGLGGPARRLAETYGCHVTGIDLTQAFCDAAETMSEWVKIGDRVTFQQGDATALPFADESVDLVFTSGVLIHVAPDELERAVREIVRVARHYVLCVEYFSHEPQQVTYRGREGYLFKRDFGKFYLEQFPALRVLDYGFLWQPLDSSDDSNWWLFAKR